MLTGWKRLTQEQREHCQEAHLRYDSDAIDTFRWHSIAEADSQMRGFMHHHPVCWTCHTIAKTLGYAYLLDVLRDIAGWEALGEDIRILYHYTTPWK